MPPCFNAADRKEEITVMSDQHGYEEDWSEDDELADDDDQRWSSRELLDAGEAEGSDE
jgi:hypothetical protein